MTEENLRSMKTLGLRSSLGSFNLPGIWFCWMSSPVFLVQSNNIWNSSLGFRWENEQQHIGLVFLAWVTVNSSTWAPGVEITSGYFRQESIKHLATSPSFSKSQKYLGLVSDVCLTAPRKWDCWWSEACSQIWSEKWWFVRKNTVKQFVVDMGWRMETIACYFRRWGVASVMTGTVSWPGPDPAGRTEMQLASGSGIVKS